MQPVASRATECLKLRVISAGVLLPVALGTAYLGGWPFAVFILIASLLAVREWDRLCGGSGNDTITLTHAVVVVGAVVLAGYNAFTDAVELIGAGAILVAVVALINRRRVLWPFIGVVYIAAPATACIYLRADAEIGRALIMWLFIVVWTTDVGAFLAGRAIGGPKLAPHISPGKTWAGVIGGIGAATIAGVVTAWVGGLAPSVVFALLGVALAIAAQLGDLAESWIKRNFHAKHSGTLIPGHGGVLDRVDGLVFAAPALAGVALLTQGGAQLWR